MVSIADRSAPSAPAGAARPDPQGSDAPRLLIAIALASAIGVTLPAALAQDRAERTTRPATPGRTVPIDGVTAPAVPASGPTLSAADDDQHRPRDCTAPKNSLVAATPDGPRPESLPWGPLLLGAVGLYIVGSIAVDFARLRR